MIGHKYYGAIGYADDTYLIAPSIYALNKMYDIYLDFTSEYDLNFNPSKRQLHSQFYFDGIQVKYSKKGYI